VKKAFTLLEVLIAVAIAGFAFGTFLTLAGKSLDTTDLYLKTTLSSIAAHNGINEAVYGGKSFNRGSVYILNYKIEVNQDFEELMGFRIVKVEAGTEGRGKLVELYESR
jgi:prepilin-type N-terminal cleavage/methylation domain-containing protein